MKKLPIAKTTIKEIVQSNSCYVDKTGYVKQLVDDNNKYWFLSRPRRFGKTLFLDTLRAAFAAEKELFKGLYLEKNWDWNVKYPIIRISFGGGTVKNTIELRIHIRAILNENSQEYAVKLSNELPYDAFRELIVKLYNKFNKPVAVLIDEYDKPILDNITESNVGEIKEELAGFYSVLKDSDQFLKFVFLTGVSKFSKTSIFSKLNNLTDISLSGKYADICGYTQIEFEDVFAEYLPGKDLDKIKEWYDGYNFLGNNVYNPFDILFYLSEKKFKSYWFETGTPTFLLNLIKEQKYFLPNLDCVILSDTNMGEFEIDNISIETLLYQTGYLAIEKEYTIGPLINYKLKIPNKEVQIGLNAYLLRMFFSPGNQPVKQTILINSIYLSLYNNKPEKLKNAFYSFFAGVPHDWYRKNKIAEYEGYYCSIFYTYFNALGLNIIPEDITNTGNIDFAVIMDNAIYIFEIKMKKISKNKQPCTAKAVNSDKNHALEQIKERKYHEKYLSENKNIFLIGIEFDKKKKNISKFECEKVYCNKIIL